VKGTALRALGNTAQVEASLMWSGLISPTNQWDCSNIGLVIQPKYSLEWWFSQNLDLELAQDSVVASYTPLWLSNSTRLPAHRTAKESKASLVNKQQDFCLKKNPTKRTPNSSAKRQTSKMSDKLTRYGQHPATICLADAEALRTTFDWREHHSSIAIISTDKVRLPSALPHHNPATKQV